MADDIFLSPEEQDERAKQWLKDNGLAIVVGIGLGFGAIFGYNHYKDGLQSDAEQASALFSTALNEIDDSKNSDIDAQVEKLKAEHNKSAYASKAVLLKASQLAVIDMPAAFNELQWVVDNAPEQGLVHTARLRQAKIKIALGELDAANQIASQQPYDGFTSHYNEVLADIRVKQGDLVGARSYYQIAIDSLNSNDASYARVLSFKIDRLPTTETDKAQSSASDANSQEN